MKKIFCPICKKELIRLEPFDKKDIYKFGCDDCDMDIVVIVNNEVEDKPIYTIVKH